MKRDNSVEIMIYVLGGISLTLCLAAIIGTLLFFW